VEIDGLEREWGTKIPRSGEMRDQFIKILCRSPITVRELVGSPRIIVSGFFASGADGPGGLALRSDSR
jgi:hypothetical protein